MNNFIGTINIKKFLKNLSNFLWSLIFCFEIVGKTEILQYNASSFSSKWKVYKNFRAKNQCFFDVQMGSNTFLAFLIFRSFDIRSSMNLFIFGRFPEKISCQFLLEVVSFSWVCLFLEFSRKNQIFHFSVYVFFEFSRKFWVSTTWGLLSWNFHFCSLWRHK